MAPFNIGLIGCGTIGTGVARLLLQHPDRLAARAGRPLVLKRVVELDPEKPRAAGVPQELVSADLRSVIDDPEIDLAIELVGGTTFARKAVLDLLAAGKHVVTANKALLATHGAEIFNMARKHDKAIGFEASVGGGIPIIAALSQGLAANQIVSIQGILNGTCNYILSNMSEKGVSYQDALAQAQKLGYAEADPTLDVNGTDTAHKLTILAQIAFGVSYPVAKIPRRGIAGLQQIDVRFAHEMGYTIKLLAEAWLHEGRKGEGEKGRKGEREKGRKGEGEKGRKEAERAVSPSPPLPFSPSSLALHVSPVLLRHQAPLAQVRDAYNAIFVVGDAVGSTLYYGRGAGQMPTASAVLADIIDLAIGRGQRTFQTMKLWSKAEDDISLSSAAVVPSRFYLRLMVQDRPGVLAEIASSLANHHISIASVMQHEALDDQEGSTVPLVIVTHSAATGNFTSAIAALDALECVAAPTVNFPIGE